MGVPCASVAVPERTRAAAAAASVICFMCVSPCICVVDRPRASVPSAGSELSTRTRTGSLDDDGALHAGLVVAGDQAGELERASLGEAPHDLRRAIRIEATPIRVVVLHVGVLLHRDLVLLVVRDGVEHEFVVDLAGVLEDEADLLTALHL